jgi:hypothetical protein
MQRPQSSMGLPESWGTLPSSKGAQKGRKLVSRGAQGPWPALVFYRCEPLGPLAMRVYAIDMLLSREEPATVRAAGRPTCARGRHNIQCGGNICGSG